MQNVSWHRLDLGFWKLFGIHWYVICQFLDGETHRIWFCYNGKKKFHSLENDDVLHG